MDSLNKAIIGAQLALAEGLKTLEAKRDQRGGGGSVDYLGWIALAVAIVAAVTAGVIAFVKSKIPS